MDPSDPISAVVPSLEGQVLRVLAGTIAPMTTASISALVTRGTYPGVRVALHRLTRMGTVHQEQVGAHLQYRANRDHLAWPAIEQAVQFANGFRTELAQRLHDFTADYLKDAGPGAGQVTVAIFGSVARGTADLDSDLDLLTVVPSKLASETGQGLADQISDRALLWIGNAVNTLHLDEVQLRQMTGRGDPLVASWIQDAVTVYGPDLRRRLQEN